MARYKRKPAIVEAFQWTGDEHQLEDPIWICEAIKKGDVFFNHAGTISVNMHIRTPGGWVVAYMGDWVICGTAGEIYPCKSSIFVNIYEPE